MTLWYKSDFTDQDQFWNIKIVYNTVRDVSHVEIPKMRKLSLPRSKEGLILGGGGSAHLQLEGGWAQGLPTGEGPWEERAQAATFMTDSSLRWKTELKQLKGSGRSLPGCNTPSIIRM